MHADQVFFDDKVLVYAHDHSAGAKHGRAKEIVARAWAADKPPKLSIQVLQETHVTLVRKGLDPVRSAEVVRNYLEWELIENRESVFRDALDCQMEFQISFWDASILAAAIAAGARELWTEDFQNNRTYRGVKIVNPFVVCPD